ncbi:MAG: 23S rRNA (guanosine(2251)-2'-O)-methyltransferase RlmB [Syntrophomonadaceae bacterium]|nr:23S rRNA (guanosine(2251)-2'-O)-methyltransferase RlmB [Syntrophomonadaceae bacterium]
MTQQLTGINSILEAIRGRRRVQKIIVQEGKNGKKIEELLRLAEKRGIFCQTVDRRRLDQMASPEPHQGVLALVDEYRYAQLEEILEYAVGQGGEPLLLILDGIEDPQNLGAIIRTAECAGVHGIIVPRHGSAEIGAAVGRASAGAVEHMRIHQAANLVNTIRALKDKGFWIMAADMDGEQDYYRTALPRPAALVIGGEGGGIRRLVKENCDLTVRIPMWGQVNSLNASIAAALLIYEVKRQQQD